VRKSYCFSWPTDTFKSHIVNTGQKYLLFSVFSTEQIPGWSSSYRPQTFSIKITVHEWWSHVVGTYLSSCKTLFCHIRCWKWLFVASMHNWKRCSKFVDDRVIWKGFVASKVLCDISSCGAYWRKKSITWHGQPHLAGQMCTAVTFHLVHVVVQCFNTLFNWFNYFISFQLWVKTWYVLLWLVTMMAKLVLVWGYLQVTHAWSAWTSFST
jgi:hypothetical protein